MKLNSSKKLSAKEREEKRIALEKEREEKRLAAEREKEEKRLKLEKEKNEREERKRQLAAEKQEKREKIEQERESKRIKLENEKQEKNAQKEEQRLKRLKELELKNQEKEKKLEEQRKLEEMEHKKQEKQQQILLNFIKKGANTSSSSLNESFKSDDNDDEVMIINGAKQTEKFKEFQLQPYQTLAVFLPDEIRKRFNKNRTSLDAALNEQNNDCSLLYLNQLKQKDYKPFKRNLNKEKYDEKNDEADIIIMDDSTKKDNKMRGKLFQFDENRRPAFFGTWRKRSKLINGRRPFSKDNEYFQYDVDSDDEWEDEAEIQGESLKDSDSEASDNENGYEFDDFMVPHGHLSDDEQGEEEGDPKENGDSRHYQPLLKERDILEERQKKMKRLQPVVIGPYWKNSADEIINDPLLKLLDQYTVMYL